MIMKRYGRNNHALRYMDSESFDRMRRIRNRTVGKEYYSKPPPWVMQGSLKRQIVRPEIHRLPLHNLDRNHNWMPSTRNLVKKYTWSNSEMAKYLKHWRN